MSAREVAQIQRNLNNQQHYFDPARAQSPVVGMTAKLKLTSLFVLLALQGCGELPHLSLPADPRGATALDNA
jgi:hypothetical protein